MFRFISSLLNLTTTPASTHEPLPQTPRLEEMRGGKGKRRREAQSEFTSYYGRPVVKRPHWVWADLVLFFGPVGSRAVRRRWRPWPKFLATRIKIVR